MVGGTENENTAWKWSSGWRASGNEKAVHKARDAALEEWGMKTQKQLTVERYWRQEVKNKYLDYGYGRKRNARQEASGAERTQNWVILRVLTDSEQR